MDEETILVYIYAITGLLALFFFFFFAEAATAPADKPATARSGLRSSSEKTDELTFLAEQVKRNSNVYTINKGHHAYYSKGSAEQYCLRSLEWLEEGDIIAFSIVQQWRASKWLKCVRDSYGKLDRDMAIKIGNVYYVDIKFINAVLKNGRSAVTLNPRFQWYAMNNPSIGCDENVRQSIKYPDHAMYRDTAFLVWKVKKGCYVVPMEDIEWTYDPVNPHPW